jgi:Rieske Fe-S protein
MTNGSRCSGSPSAPSADGRRAPSCAAPGRRALIMGLAALPMAAAVPRAARGAGPVLAVVDQARLAAPWSSAEFSFDLDGDRLPGIVIRLPDGRWYASSLICSHMKCVVRYFADVAMARDTFDVAVNNPVLGCPCHFSVYDVANGGKVIGGPAPGPLLQLAVEARDGKLYITR